MMLLWWLGVTITVLIHGKRAIISIQYIYCPVCSIKFTIWQSTWLPLQPTSSGWRQLLSRVTCWPGDESPNWPRTRHRQRRCYTSPGSPPCQWPLRIRNKLLLIIPKMAWRQTDNQLNGKLHGWFLPLVFSGLNFPNEPAVKCTFLPSHLCLSLCWGVMWRHSWWCLPPTWCCRMTCTCWSPGYPG